MTSFHEMSGEIKKENFDFISKNLGQCKKDEQHFKNLITGVFFIL